MRRLSLRIRLAALASAVMLAIGLGAAGFAAPAFAVDDIHMYVNATSGHYSAIVTQCDAGTYVDLAENAYSGYWNAPTTSGQISCIPHSTMCMTIDTSNNRIHLSACTGGEYQEWVAHAKDGGYWYSNTKTGLCLNAHTQAFQADAATCNQGVNEIWHLS